MTDKRNHDRYTPESQVRANILNAMRLDTEGHALSQLGAAGFPDYNFQNPQGAALSVSRIVKRMQADGLIEQKIAYNGWLRYFITPRGFAS